MKLLLVALVCFVVATNAQGGVCNFDWDDRGTDWPGLGALQNCDNNMCGGDQQSPIDIDLEFARLTNVPFIRSINARMEERRVISNAFPLPLPVIGLRDNSTSQALDDHPSDDSTESTQLILKDEHKNTEQDREAMIDEYAEMLKRKKRGVFGTDMMVTVLADGFDNIYMVGGTVGEPWQLLFYQFHGPSEHTFEGLQFPLEVQWVHDSGYGQFAIVSYLFRVVDFSASFIAAIANAIRNGEATALLQARLPITRGTFFHYRGSFTTPPCLERVDWHVYHSLIPITQADVDTIRGAMTNFNIRTTQPLGSRSIGVSDGCGFAGRNRFAFNARGRSCAAHHFRRSADGWEHTPYAADLRKQEKIIRTLYQHRELRDTAELFADIWDYNKRAIMDDASVDADYQYSKSFPPINDPVLSAHVDELAGAFARATISMESIDYTRYDPDSVFDNFHTNSSGLVF